MKLLSRSFRIKISRPQAFRISNSTLPPFPNWRGIKTLIFRFSPFPAFHLLSLPNLYLSLSLYPSLNLSLSPNPEREIMSNPITSASSSASGGTTVGRRRLRTRGIPTRCWCGESIKGIISKSQPNPYRRYYRCVYAANNRVRKLNCRWFLILGCKLNFFEPNVVARERRSRLQMGWWSFHRWDSTVRQPIPNRRRGNSIDQSNNKEWRSHQNNARDHDVRSLCYYHLCRCSSRNIDVQVIE